MPTVSGTVADASGNVATWSASWTETGGIPAMPPPGRMYYGSSIEGADSNLTAFEDAHMGGAGMQFYRKYFQTGSSAASIVNSVSSNVGQGRQVLASFKFPVSWQQVAAGADDARMTAVAQGFNSLSLPTWVIFHHEPNGDTNSTNQRPEDFRAMYAHLTALFRQHAPGMVAVVLCLNGQPLEANPGVATQLIPDDGDYDLFGFDRYNAWWPPDGGTWRWPEDTLGELMPYVPAGKRWVIGEFGCREDPTNLAKAPDWLRRHYDFCLANGAAAVCYFNSGANSPEGPWVLDGARLTEWKRLRGLPTTHRVA